MSSGIRKRSRAKMSVLEKFHRPVWWANGIVYITWCHTKFAAAGIALVLLWGYISIQPMPVTLHVGRIGSFNPDGTLASGPVKSGDFVGVQWDRTWSRNCNISVVAFIKDGSRETPILSPDGKKEMIVEPPDDIDERGWSTSRTFRIPPVVGSRAEYHTIITPRCWYDSFLRVIGLGREFKSLPIPFAIVGVDKQNAK